MKPRSRKPSPKGKARPKPKIKARVSQKASIAEFSSAVLANLEDRYWEYAEPVLRGQVAKDDYPTAAAYLNAFKEAGDIIKATLLEQQDDEDQDHGKE